MSKRNYRHTLLIFMIDTTVNQAHLFARGGYDAGACHSEGDRRGGSLHKARQVLISDVLTQLDGGKGHFKGNLHAWADVAFSRCDG